MSGPGAPDVQPFRFSWAFVLRPEPGVGTRLVVRECFLPLTVLARLEVELVLPVSAVMTWRMLRGIWERAERMPVAPEFPCAPSSQAQPCPCRKLRPGRSSGMLVLVEDAAEASVWERWMRSGES
ncbi:hypothetical protein AB0I53_40320 [Saccharopolyspora sp. NPDC050389]|uniref:hypothetical protein n=1 Tax=Saccharopolyspora sp. NPDC050389 TaxID=3155516 RepID=UPI003405F0A8